MKLLKDTTSNLLRLFRRIWPTPSVEEPRADKEQTHSTTITAGRNEEVIPLNPMLAAGSLLLNRFEIRSFINRGGMGEVYIAFDNELDETVALKTIRPAIASNERVIERFKREVKSSRQVKHPNVCRVHDFFRHSVEGGQDILFFTMELLRGETLSAYLQRHRQMAQPLAISLVRQMAEGLEAAHRAGVIHGDFKSSNVILVNAPDVGLRAVITDFGLARTLSDGHGVNQTISIQGTPMYMAPEQLSGHKITVASDVYSLGVVLYEMLTGAFPFHPAAPVALALKKLNESPAPLRVRVPDIDVAWERVIAKCLEKDPGKRFSKPTDLVKALPGASESLAPRWRTLTRRGFLAAAATAVLVFALNTLINNPGRPPDEIKTLAVLPFENLGLNADDEFLTDGLTEELIGQLANMSGLRVINRSSAFRFKTIKEDPKKIGQQLRVDHLLTGTVRVTGGFVKVTAELSQAGSGYQLWSKTFEQSVAELTRIQQEVVTQVARELNPTSIASASSRRYSENFEAYNRYLRGRYHFNQRTPQSLQLAIRYFEEAISLDPRFALAHSGIADCYSALSDYRFIPATEALPKAKKAALLAISLDPALAEAQTSLGLVSSLDVWDWVYAEQSFEQAIRLNAGYAPSHHWYAAFLMKMKRTDEALREIDTAQHLDPLSVPVNAAHAWLLYYARRPDDAVAQMQSAIELDPKFTNALALFAQAFALKRQFPEAVRHAEAGYNQDSGYAVASLAWTLSLAGEKARARQLLNRIEERKLSVSPSIIAAVYAGLGETDLAFDWLDRAYSERDSSLLNLQIQPYYDVLRQDTRYQRLADRIGFPRSTEKKAMD